MSNTISATYTDDGQKDIIRLPIKQDGDVLFSVKAGSSDVVSVEVQIAPDAQRVGVPSYKSISGDFIGRIPANCAGIGLNITTNTSEEIIFDISAK